METKHRTRLKTVPMRCQRGHYGGTEPCVSATPLNVRSLDLNWRGLDSGVWTLKLLVTGARMVERQNGRKIFFSEIFWPTLNWHCSKTSGPIDFYKGSYRRVGSGKKSDFKASYAGWRLLDVQSQTQSDVFETINSSTFALRSLSQVWHVTSLEPFNGFTWM